MADDFIQMGHAELMRQIAALDRQLADMSESVCNLILSVYEPLSYDDETLIAANVANFVEFEKYEYHKYWRDIGNFSLTLPASAAGIGYVHKDMILFVDEGGDGNINDCLIINEVQDDGLRVTLLGTDLKGLLSYRVTMFPQEEIEAGTYGHDVRQGSTGSIIAGYITYNCIEATDNDRNIPGLRIGYSGGGIQNDTYRVIFVLWHVLVYYYI